MKVQWKGESGPHSKQFVPLSEIQGVALPYCYVSIPTISPLTPTPTPSPSPSPSPSSHRLSTNSTDSHYSDLNESDETSTPGSSKESSRRSRPEKRLKLPDCSFARAVLEGREEEDKRESKGEHEPSTQEVKKRNTSADEGGVQTDGVQESTKTDEKVNGGKVQGTTTSSSQEETKEDAVSNKRKASGADTNIGEVEVEVHADAEEEDVPSTQEVNKRDKDKNEEEEEEEWEKEFNSQQQEEEKKEWEEEEEETNKEQSAEMMSLEEYDSARREVYPIIRGPFFFLLNFI